MTHAELVNLLVRLLPTRERPGFVELGSRHPALFASMFDARLRTIRSDPTLSKDLPTC